MSDPTNIPTPIISGLVAEIVESPGYTWSHDEICRLIEKAKGLERENVTLAKERDEALKWKNEDPRMLREQIRVADEAFNTLTQQRDELKAEVEKLKPNQREHDLVRQQRAELHRVDLITDDEYTMLVSERDAVQRLEDYDKVQLKISLLEKTICELREELSAAKATIAQWQRQVRKPLVEDGWVNREVFEKCVEAAHREGYAARHMFVNQLAPKLGPTCDEAWLNSTARAELGKGEK